MSPSQLLTQNIVKHKRRPSFHQFKLLYPYWLIQALVFVCSTWSCPIGPAAGQVEGVESDDRLTD